jgi:hypothetical protein
VEVAQDHAELVAVGRGEPGEEVVFDPCRGGRQFGRGRASGVGEGQDSSVPIRRIYPAIDEAPADQAVDDGHDVAGVDRDDPGQVVLGNSR